MHKLSVLVAAAFLLAGCEKAPPEPTPSREESARSVSQPVAASASAAPTGSASTSALSSEAPKPVMQPKPSVPPSPDDPIKGVWTLDDATKGLAGKGQLKAVIETDLGKLDCRLLEDKAPATVANFVGLARGTRPWKDPSGAWVKKPAYDGTVFHRIIKGFMIQGGDARGNGTGEPGYVIADEVWPGAKHDRAGLLCMANRGPNTNGAQFFITDAAAPHLDRSYTIFGECGPEEAVHKIASVEVMGERPKTAPKIKSVTIRRAP